MSFIESFVCDFVCFALMCVYVLSFLGGFAAVAMLFIDWAVADGGTTKFIVYDYTFYMLSSSLSCRYTNFNIHLLHLYRVILRGQQRDTKDLLEKTGCNLILMDRWSTLLIFCFSPRKISLFSFL